MVRIESARCLENFEVEIQFTDGSTRNIDLAPFLTGPIFEPLLSDRNSFLAVQVDPELGTLVWPNGADIDPDVLYHNRTPASRRKADDAATG